MTLSEQIVYGMVKPSKYKELLELKKGRGVLYIFVLMLALAVATFVIPTAATIVGFGGFEKLFSKTIAPFEYKDGTLHMEKPFKMAIGLNYIVVDASVETIPDDMLERNGIYYAIGSESLRIAYVMEGDILAGDSFDLDLLFEEGFNNQILQEMIPGIYVFLVLMFFLTAVGHFISYGIMALLFSLCVNGMSKRLQTGLSYRQVFMLCFYGQSLYMVVSIVNSMLGLLPSFLITIIGFFVTINFITKALISMGKINHV